MELIDTTQAEFAFVELTNAVLLGDNTRLRQLINDGACVNGTTANGVTPLMIAAYEALPSTMTLLLDAGASVKTQDLMGNTPLHWAVRSHTTVPCSACIGLLLDAGADIGALNRLGDTPLLKAIKCAGTLAEYVGDHATPIILLIERGSDVLTCDGQGQSAREALMKSARGFSDSEFSCALAAIDCKLLRGATALTPHLPGRRM